MPYVVAAKQMTNLVNAHSPLSGQLSYAEAYYYLAMLLWRRLFLLLQMNGSLPDELRAEASLLASQPFLVAPTYFREYLNDLGNFVNESGETFRYSLPFKADSLDFTYHGGISGMLGDYRAAWPRVVAPFQELQNVRSKILRYAWAPSPFVVALNLQERATSADGLVNEVLGTMFPKNWSPTEFFLGITPIDVVEAETTQALKGLGWGKNQRPDDAIGFTNMKISSCLILCFTSLE